MFMRSTAVALALTLAGCGEGLPAVEEQAAPEPVPVVLPAGDATAGRQAFLDLKCTVCHAVSAETDFPSPFGDWMGPAFNAELARQDISALAAAIVTPSHSLSEQMDQELRAELEGALSPMGDFSQAMTVRQLVDLVAYIRSLE